MAAGDIVSIIENRKKNHFINSGFDFHQRANLGANITMSTTREYLSGDRWLYELSNLNSGGSVEVIAGSPNTESQNNSDITYQRVGAGGVNITMEQRIEAKDCQELIKDGKMSISFQMRMNANAVEFGSGNLKVRILTPTALNNHTVQTTEFTTGNIGNPTGANIWEIREIQDLDVPANASLGLAIQFIFILPDVTASGSERLRFTQFMLNAGSVVAPWVRSGKNVAEELAFCQRYYEKSYNLST